MKAILAAGLAAATLVTGIPAEAQRFGNHDGYGYGGHHGYRPGYRGGYRFRGGGYRHGYRYRPYGYARGWHGRGHYRGCRYGVHYRSRRCY